MQRALEEMDGFDLEDEGGAEIKVALDTGGPYKAAPRGQDKPAESGGSFFGRLGSSLGDSVGRVGSAFTDAGGGAGARMQQRASMQWQAEDANSCALQGARRWWWRRDFSYR